MRGKTLVAVGVAVAVAVPLLGPRSRPIANLPRHVNRSASLVIYTVMPLPQPRDAAEQCGLVRYAFRWEPTRCGVVMLRGSVAGLPTQRPNPALAAGGR